jgi:acetyl-CoA carboxylase/biotin carboxylase 1
MKAKGVIRDVVTWKRSRSYFFWRAKRRIAEDSLVRAFQVRLTVQAAGGDG